MNLQLALFVARSRVVRNAAILMFIVGVIAVGVNGVVRTMQVPSWALADTTVGAAEHMMRVPIDGDLPLSDDGQADAAILAALSAGADEARIGYTGAMTQIDDTRDTTLLMQQKWADDPFPNGYILQSGRFPAGVDEAAVSPSFAKDFPIGAKISFFHGALSLTVVGVAEDQTSRFGELVVLDNGTLEALSDQHPDTFNRYPMSFSPTLYWSGAEPTVVAAAVAGVLTEASTSAEQLIAATESHDAISDSPAPRLIELDLVATLLPLTASVVIGWGMNRYLGRLRRTLIQLGVTRTVGGLYGTAVATTVLGAAIGGFAGIGLVFLLRPLLAVASSSVLSSPRGIAAFVAMVAGITVIGAVVTLFVGRAGSSGQTRRELSVTRRPWLQGGIGAAGFAVGVVLLQSSDANSKIAALVLTSAGLCLILSLVLRLLPKRSDATALVLAVRRVRGEGRGSTWTVIALSVLLATGFTLATTYASDSTTRNDQLFAGVPTDQAYFEPAHPDDQLISELEQYLGADEPVEFWAAAGLPVAADGLAIATGTVNDVARLIDRPLNSSEKETLISGGALLTAPGESLHLETEDGKVVDFAGAFAEDLPQSFRRYSGIMLKTSPEQAGLALVRHTWVFTDLSDEQAQRAESAPGALGFDSEWLDTHRQPDAFEVMGVLIIILGAILVIGMCVIVAYSAMTARAMRPRSAGLIAVGLGRAWLARATSAEIGLIVLLSMAIAILASVISVAGAIAIGAVSLTLSIPWGLLGIVIATLVVVAAIAAGVSTRRLRMVERQTRW